MLARSGVFCESHLEPRPFIPMKSIASIALLFLIAAPVAHAQKGFKLKPLKKADLLEAGLVEVGPAPDVVLEDPAAEAPRGDEPVPEFAPEVAVVAA